MGLNDGYSNARSQILMKSHVPNVNQAYAMVLQDENQKLTAGSGGMDPTALFTARGSNTKPKKYGVECDFCHVQGHTRDKCFKLMKCSHCQLTGHLKEKCYKLIGYPPDFKSKRKDLHAGSNLVQAEGNASNAIPATSITSPMFTHEQYTRLLGLLNTEGE